MGVQNHPAACRQGADAVARSGDRGRLRRAAAFALAAMEDAGERGWALGDAVCALEMALGRPVSPDAQRRTASIDPCLAEPPG